MSDVPFCQTHRDVVLLFKGCWACLNSQLNADNVRLQMVADEAEHLREELKRLKNEHATLREAAFAVEAFALPYWEDEHEIASIPVSNEALRDLQAALYPDNAKGLR
jgi:hypothetical protein